MTKGKFDQPLISVGIPTYNRPKGLENVINDFLNQSYQNLEIIISNNSYDNPDVNKICEKFEQVDSRIKYFRQKENIGMYKNFEFVRSRAKGKYFCWASDDDEFDKNYILYCLEEYKKNPELILVGPICVLKLNGKELFKRKYDFDTVGLTRTQRINKIANYIRKSHMALYGLFKTEIIKKIPVLSILDSDGRIILEYCNHGAFKMLHKPLVSASLPFRYQDKINRKNFIDQSGFRHSFFLKHFETSYMSIYMTRMILKQKSNTPFEKLLAAYFILKAYHNNRLFFRPIHTIYNFFNGLKKKKTVLHISVQNINELYELKRSFTDFDYCNIFITKSPVFDEKEFDMTSISFNSKFKLINHIFRNQADERQYVLDRAKFQLNGITDIELYSTKRFKENKKLILKIGKIKQATYFKDELIAYPVKSYVNFKLSSDLTIGKKRFQ